LGPSARPRAGPSTSAPGPMHQPRCPRPAMPRELAIAVHDVEPATFERCALIRDWLDDHGVEKVTLLVIPAPDLHPLDDRCPELVHWLAERRELGDAIAQHGLHHRRL